MVRVKAVVSTARYAARMEAGGHAIVSDAPEDKGAHSCDRAPYDLLLAGLAACTLRTLRTYADRKRWALAGAHVELRYLRDSDGEFIARRLRLEGELSEEQRARLAEIAEKTPVTLTLKRGLSLSTEFYPPSASLRHAAEVDARLDEALDESFPASDSPRVNA